MSTTLTADFEGGANGTAINTSNTPFNSVSSSGLTFDSTHARAGLAAKCNAVSTSTRGMWWSSTGALGGTITSLFGREYVYFTAAPPALARINHVQSGGAILAGVCIDTTRKVVIRNVKAGSTPTGGTSTTVLATNTLHRIEYNWVLSATNAQCTVKIFSAGNVEGSTPTETLTVSGMALAATADSVLHGLAFSTAQTWSVWLDDIGVQFGSGATWLGPASGGGGGGGGGTGGTTVLGMLSSPDGLATEGGSVPSGLGVGPLAARVYRNWPTKNNGADTLSGPSNFGIFQSTSIETNLFNAGQLVAISLSMPNDNSKGYTPDQYLAASSTTGTTGGTIQSEVDAMFTRIFALQFGVGGRPNEIHFIYEHEMDLDPKFNTDATHRQKWRDVVKYLRGRANLAATAASVPQTRIKWVIVPAGVWNSGTIGNWWTSDMDAYLNIAGADMYNDVGDFNGGVIAYGTGTGTAPGSWETFQHHYTNGGSSAGTTQPNWAAAKSVPTGIYEFNSVNTDQAHPGGDSVTGTNPDTAQGLPAGGFTKQWWANAGAYIAASCPELKYIFIFDQRGGTNAIWDIANAHHPVPHAGVVQFATSINAYGGGSTGGGGLTLQYDMNADTWTTSGHGIAGGTPWASLPSKLNIYSARQSDWGYTAQEHITSGTYADGTKYFQMAMKHLAAGDANARFGTGWYGCRFYFDTTATSITVGRIQWTEEWTGAALVKTSMMLWPDTGNWPVAGERDCLEQTKDTAGGTGTMHKAGAFDPNLYGPGKGGYPNVQQVRQYTNTNMDSRRTLRTTFLATKAYTEILQGDGTWRLLGTWTDPTFWQPSRGYHCEGALAYSQTGANPDDPGRGAATRKISGIKIWSGTTTGPGTDTTPPTPATAPTPTAAVQGVGPSVNVVWGASADTGSGIDHYTVQRAYDSANAPDLTTIVTFDNLQNTQYLDTGTAVGDKVYYRERATNGATLTNTYSAWSTRLTVTGPQDPPTCVLSVAPANGSVPPGDAVSVFDGNSGVIFSAASTIGADTILVDPGDGSGTILTINPADGAVDPNTGSVLYPSYPPGQKSYTATATAINSVGTSTDTVAINVIEAAGDTTTATPRDVWVVPGQPAYRRGDNIDNDLYLLLGLDEASDVPTLVPAQNSDITFCVDAGPAGPTPAGGGGGNGNDPDIIIVSGNVAVATNVYPTGYTMGADGILTELRSYVETAPALGSITVVWKLNGSALGTVTIADGQTDGLLDLSVTVSAGDVLKWDVTSTGSFAAGANLHASWSGAT